MQKAMVKYLVSGILFFSFLIIGCGGQDDSVKEAIKANEREDKPNDTLTAMNVVSEWDAKFMVEAASSTLTEAMAGKLAADKASNTFVKAWGNKMHKKHLDIFSELKNLASLKNVTLPESMGTAHKSQLEELQEKQSGFDANYISLLIDLHEEAIKKYQQAANNAKSPEVKSFASKYLPELRTHLDSARLLKDKL